MDKKMYMRFRNSIETLFYDLYKEDLNIIEKPYGCIWVERCSNGDKYITGIYVLPEYRKQGKGRELVREYVSEYGMPTILHILKNNHVARKFWHKVLMITPIESTNYDVLYRIEGFNE